MPILLLRSHATSCNKLVKARSIITILALILCVAGIACGQDASQRYLDDIKHLTAPEMEGRGGGTKGLTRAEHLIEQRYKSLGLEPAPHETNIFIADWAE
jgi:hypothetical protein